MATAPKGWQAGLRCARAPAVAPAELPADHPVWHSAAHTLAWLFHNLVLSVVPERILVGGGVIGGQPQLLPQVRNALLASLNGYAHAVRIARAPAQFLVPPALGERSGSLGALVLARHALARQAPRRAST